MTGGEEHDEVSARTLHSLDPDAKVDWGPDAISKIAPEIRLDAFKVLGIWSLIESELTRMICLFVEDEHHIVSEMLAAIENTGAKAAAFGAAGARALGEESFEYVLFDRLLRKVNDKRRLTRNRYAHFIMGHSEELPGRMILIDPRAQASWWGSVVRTTSLFFRWLEDARQSLGPDEVPTLHEGELEFPSNIEETQFSYVYDGHRVKQDVEMSHRLYVFAVTLSVVLDGKDSEGKRREWLATELGVEDPTSSQDEG